MKTIARIFLVLSIISLGSQPAFSEIKEGSIITLTPAIIAAAAKCNYSLVGSWISTNRNPSEYETFLSFTESGEISEIGDFNVAHPPGSYKLKPDCSIIATITEANNNILSLTGEIVSNNSMYLTVDNQGDDIELVKVSDTGACQVRCIVNPAKEWFT